MLYPFPRSTSPTIYRGADDVDVRITFAESYAEAAAAGREEVPDDYYVSKVLRLGRNEYLIVARPRVPE